MRHNSVIYQNFISILMDDTTNRLLFCNFREYQQFKQLSAATVRERGYYVLEARAHAAMTMLNMPVTTVVYMMMMSF